jgi:uncharacterized membrane protein
VKLINEKVIRAEITEARLASLKYPELEIERIKRDIQHEAALAFEKAKPDVFMSKSEINERPLVFKEAREYYMKISYFEALTIQFERTHPAIT